MINKKIQYYYIATALVLATYGLWKLNHHTSAPFQTKLSNTEKIKVESLLKNLRTRCIGRFLVDLPASYAVAENSSEVINESKIITNRMYPPSFEQLVHLREQELLATKTIGPEDMPYLKKSYPLPQGLNGIIFERVNSPGTPDAFRMLEAHLYSNGVAIKIEVEAKNGSATRYDAARINAPNSYKNNVSETLSKLNDLLLRIQGRAENEIPITPGTCIQNAFIADNGKDKEEIDVLFKGDNDSQIRFGISTDNFTREKDSLLERSNDILANLLSSNGSVFRKGARKINQLDIEELLAAGDYSSSGNKRYDFIMLTNEKTGSYKTPVFSLELLNEEWIPSPYNQDEIVSFWDAI
ncbi:T6SS immunity protein Tli4 family protein, partial [Buttiauxella massiliensis]|uniref:T6SS immunity protein Tli4 family protein n=1 Tax=Buttiauxella massiliensis TaxID=2831590 RepID=UPI00186AA521